MCVHALHYQHGIFPLAELNTWQSSRRADPCLSTSTLAFNPADVHVGLRLFFRPSAALHLQHMIVSPDLLRQRVEKQTRPVHQIPARVEDLGESCFSGSKSILTAFVSQASVSTLARHSMKVYYVAKSLSLCGVRCFFCKNTIMWTGKTLDSFSIHF